MRELGAGVFMYVQDWDERMPPADRWLDVITPYGEARPGSRPCPAYDGRHPYAMNAALVGIALARIDSPSETVMLVEHPCERANETTDRIVPDAYRHRGIANVVHTDGRASWHGVWHAQPLRWEPSAEDASHRRR